MSSAVPPSPSASEALWSLLRCPQCLDALELTVYSREDAAPKEALLRSGCGLWFPVVDGIPRIFIGELRAEVYPKDFGDFLSKHDLSIERTTEGTAAVSAETQAKLDTRESFGYEWTHFHDMLPEWDRVAEFYFEPIGGPDKTRDLLVLDAGCGKGRQAFYALRAGARAVCVDFSRAIDVARNNCREYRERALFVQSDLLALPFSPESFDLGYSFGVLHHLPDPEAGFASIVRQTRRGGQVLVYLYHALEGEPVKQTILGAVTAVRRVTSKMPHRLLLPLTTALGYGLYAGVVLPYKLLTRIPATHDFAESLPLKFYADYPLHVIVNDQFDRFSAPLERRYRRAEVEGWFSRAHLEPPVILGGAGWRAAARRPAASQEAHAP